MRSAQILHRIEPAEDGEVLPHREPHRHVDIGAFEIHPAEHLGALLRHRMAEHLDAPRGRQHQPHDHGDRRGLAGAVAAEQAGDAAARDPERHIVDRAGGLVELDRDARPRSRRSLPDRPRATALALASLLTMRAVHWAISGCERKGLRCGGAGPAWFETRALRAPHHEE